MDAIAKFQYLSLVGKVVSELDNHLGLKDKDLAEFIINLADTSDSLEARTRYFFLFWSHIIQEFRAQLNANGGDDFPEQFVNNLYKLIKVMRPPKREPVPSAPAAPRATENTTYRQDEEMKDREAVEEVQESPRVKRPRSRSASPPPAKYASNALVLSYLYSVGATEGAAIGARSESAMDA